MTFAAFADRYRRIQSRAQANQLADRCPVCRFPRRNGAQVSCEPGVCMYREVPVRYARED